MATTGSGINQAAGGSAAQAPQAATSIQRGESASRMSTAETVRHEQNAAIITASLQVSIKAGNDSLALLYRSAIDHLNEVLAPGQNVDVIGKAMEQDNSPEATAERILSFATGFFDAYAAQHPGKDTDTLARDFTDLVRGGFEKGFNEARDILQGLGVLGGSDIESGIMKTYELVSKGFDDFLAAKLKPAAEAQPQTDEGAKPAEKA
ncbi:DUF5610 domain-containing protein [Thauera linaloolentis]|uniref:DUF5610 domain-containing protein n=1 Tax=Thauera linaloolentis (strain DSM 12138 / JCM 21573 / CCUG 41526 / CIP 105981 / IAM 15112 / NBRC 102519 / 47Lol) TaxID=1123367 RepID=N6Z7T3_THAL4|nr:DUF5610 domain-containing protein [Thauera linaloolentis]ENO88229.1 hypothetical protein C666_09215 [Thauera linaloolentis 47Lol = DSM 12138]MCM8566854.1 DUF5610 domain-containing protein [Thauera linaloolentis]